MAKTFSVPRGRAAAVFFLALLCASCGSPYDGVANLGAASGASVVFLGDSLTAGTGARPGEDFPSRLAGALPLPVVNAGVPGNTTADALARLERDVFPHDPRLVVVLLGGNDFLRRVPKEQVRTNLDAILSRIRERGAMAALVGVKIGFFGGDALGEIYEDAARENGAYYIENVWKGVFGESHLMSDKIHPNGAGYKIIASRLAEELKPLLEESARRQ